MARKPSRTEKKLLKQGKKPSKPPKASSKSTASKNQPQQGRPQKPKTVSAKLPHLKKGSYFIFGRNAIEAALKNEDRDCLRLIGIEKALVKAEHLMAIRPGLRVDGVKSTDLFKEHVPADSPHQGILLEVLPLREKSIEDFNEAGDRQLMLILDQVTDPQNVGACLRAGAALGAHALITPDRNCPLENGTIARTSAGGLESLPWLRIGNLAATLDDLKDKGFWVVGLDGDTDTSLREIDSNGKIALVMGNEGRGMRDLTRKQCDIIAKIPMTGRVESLNVATAAAIALYELGQTS
ncbi:23S rRNA (guanosine(2251)-2'-O)-methyltransferase RlmB [Temperatibacter marinus]|uniref:23S rRNA (Guanosine(2251)-2'-O)-methyltransferase RlmB n=1 Tax=Temperatibacter marinus TaxID=1456591 RepID=A0AA52EGP1_9PROT|nr:23S rRNA (guanosine(2251)-2'-O)-methyltransferase RlmB [Temperatibacter marinus]WND02808.1 23S rRNA (guanosine(2251)-2'-O)-methyltransferase RlmB [Temperatibacter marinus]